jgi:hypothetical protein
MRQSNNNGAAVGCLLILLVITAPMWLVVLSGLMAPFLIAGAILLTIAGVIRSWFK